MTLRQVAESCKSWINNPDTDTMMWLSPTDPLADIITNTLRCEAETITHICLTVPEQSYMDMDDPKLGQAINVFSNITSWIRSSTEKVDTTQAQALISSFTKRNPDTNLWVLTWNLNPNPPDSEQTQEQTQPKWEVTIPPMLQPKLTEIKLHP